MHKIIFSIVPVILFSLLTIIAGVFIHKRNANETRNELLATKIDTQTGSIPVMWENDGGMITSEIKTNYAIAGVDLLRNRAAFLFDEMNEKMDFFGDVLYVDETGQVLTTGCVDNGVDYDMILLRYTSDGIPDNTFNSQGYATHHNAAGGNGCDWGLALAEDHSGKIVVAGMSWNGIDYDMVIWRFTEHGTLDTTFHYPYGYKVVDTSLLKSKSDESIAVLAHEKAEKLIEEYSK